jgi:putative peptide zinc metalloprotease protein
MNGAATSTDPDADPLDRIELPPLRDDLELLSAPDAPDGSPCWTIYDPVRNRYFRIGHESFEAIARWSLSRPRAIADAVSRETGLALQGEDVVKFYQFLSANTLTRADDLDLLARLAALRRVSWYVWLLHNYLFIRIPLVRPDRFLSATRFLAAPFASPAWRWFVIAATLLGLLLASRQWDAFRHTFLHFFTVEGMALYGITLIGTKTLHELGHAYTAKRHGCRIPTMGVAFLVMWPVLYTDTSDAWRLVERKTRLEIAAAGMLTELALAGLATLAWSFLPDGPVRSAAFFVATVSWVSTLLINMSPFMRFDGYYLLSDLLDVANLQQRAFALGRWWLRERLFGFGAEAPERHEPRLKWVLLTYCYATWIYRLILFTGIALIVYHMFAKILGIGLFMVEIGWFVMLPFINEFRSWWRMRQDFRINRSLLVTLAVLVGLAGLTLTPVTGRVTVPVVWRATGFAAVFSPVPAVVVTTNVALGERVNEGDILFRLAAPELEHRLAQTSLKIALFQSQIDRFSAAREGLDLLRVMEEDLAAALAEQRGLRENRERLIVRAPLSGQVTELAEGLRAGCWVNSRLVLAQVVADGPSELVGYVAEADLERVLPGASARFHPDDPLKPRFDARVVSVDRVGAATLDPPALASLFGGPVAVEGQPNSTGRPNLKPVDAVYRVILSPEGPRASSRPPFEERGIAHVDAEARSLAGRFLRTAASVLIRESGF